jgi:hypothetical protein
MVSVWCSFWRRVLALAAGDDPLLHGFGQGPWQLTGLFNHLIGAGELFQKPVTAVARPARALVLNARTKGRLPS